MIKFIKSFFSKKEEAKVEEVPYKVEAPATKYEDHKTTKPAPAPVADKAVEAVVTSIAPAKKKPAKKPAATKKQGTKPRKPKAPKAPKA